MSDKSAKDIYLQLLGAIMGKTIKEPEKTYILQSKQPHDERENVEDINQALMDSCLELRKKLKINDMCVGSPFGYIEPCPIQYTGKTQKDEKIFDCVFIGLNPHLEPCTPFPHCLDSQKTVPKDITFADLANFHHPDDILHNCPKNRYSSEGDIKNNYWRVFGHMEPKETWSPYYQDVIRIHMTLLGDDKYKKDTWKELEDTLTSKEKYSSKKEFMTTKILEDLRQCPIANAELIPYKSQEFTSKNWSKLIMHQDKTANNYKDYLKKLFDFIDLNAKKDAYIVVTTKSEDLSVMYNLFSSHKHSFMPKNIHGISDGLFWFQKKQKIIIPDSLYKQKQKDIEGLKKEKDELQKKIKETKKKSKEEVDLKKALEDVKDKIELAENYIQSKSSRENIPIFLLRWEKRPVIIIPSISRQSPYGQVLIKLKTNDWISAIKKEFSDKCQLKLA